MSKKKAMLSQYMAGRSEQYEQLFKLMWKNPGLPVAPMASGEIAGDSCGFWLGKRCHGLRLSSYILKAYIKEAF